VQIELLPGLTNVIRFPLEERVRPSIMLLHEIEPDVREVLNLAEAFQFAGPDLDLEHATDRETAAYIAEQILPAEPHELKVKLDALLQPVVEQAVEACRAAHAASKSAVQAQQKRHEATVGSGFWLGPLEARATSLTEHAVRLLIAAYDACQQAHGVSRAVWYARRGEPWRPFDATEEAERFLLGKTAAG
jgi:hypothetical protein